MEDLSTTVTELLKVYGASHVGICTIDTLAGGPPSADITYAMPTAKSAVVFAVPLNQDLIPGFLKKEDPLSHEKNSFQTNVMAGGLSVWGANFFNQRGHAAITHAPNDNYRKDSPDWLKGMHPDISLRYLAVRSGIGYFGFSGNLITPDKGAGVILGCFLTEAKLEPTDPLPAADNYCDKCGLCMASCASGLADPKETTTITLGGVSFEYSARRSYDRCNYVCGGFTGLHASGKWSTWSPARFPIPEDDPGFTKALRKHFGAYTRRPESPGGYPHSLLPGQTLHQTCGNCQIICHPDKEVRKERYKMLKNGGVVVQHTDGRLESMSVEDATDFIAAMPEDRKKIYEIVD